jgi:hypothetical protein
MVWWSWILNSSVDWSDSGVSHDEAEALKSKSPKAKTFSRLAASFIINMMRATW